MTAATPRLNDYLPIIGRLTIASARLEEIALLWGAELSESDPRDVRRKQQIAGLRRNLQLLRTRVDQLVTGPKKATILKLIDEADALRTKRNESVHGVWGEMVKLETGEFVEVSRSRFFPNGTGVAWDVGVPTVQQLAADAKRMNGLSSELHRELDLAWTNNDGVTGWRLRKNR
jgi:hypothetical protein